MRVPTEVLEHVLGAGERPLGIDDPVPVAQSLAPSREGAEIGEIGGAGGEGEQPSVARLLQAFQIFGAEPQGLAAEARQ